MAIEQKIISLYCGLPAGLNFISMDDMNVLPLKHVPFELQLIVSYWLNAINEVEQDQKTEIEIAREHPQHGLALTEIGWNWFVSWMLDTLQKEQSNEKHASNIRKFYLKKLSASV